MLSDAAKDYEILEDVKEQTLAMGLVRSTRLRIPCDNRLWMEYPGDESSQSLRSFTYRYAFMPHTGTWETVGLYNEALAFAAPLKVCEFGRQDGDLDEENSFAELEGAFSIRLFTPTGHEVSGKLTPGFDCPRATAVGPDGTPRFELPVKDGPHPDLPGIGRSVPLTVGKGKIFTVELR